MIDIEVKHPCLQFTKEEVEQTLAQYNRTLNNIQVDIDSIKTWLETQPHLTYIPEERIMVNLLILNKFSIEKAKTKLDYYLSIRSALPEIFENSVPSNPEIIALRKAICCFTLPKLINLNRVIFFTFPELKEKFNGYRGITKGTMDLQGLMYRDIHNSLELVLDYSQTNFTFWSIFTPTMAKIVVNFGEKMLSNRLAAVRIIGLPTLAEKLVNYGMSLVPQKIKQRISFHRDRKEMAKLYPLDQLPVEFGGTRRSYLELSAEFNEMVDQCEEEFVRIQKFHMDESLRPTPLDNDDLLGFHGNFRKLEVD